MTVPSLPGAVTLSQPRRWDVSWLMPSAEPSSSVPQDLPISLGSCGGAAGGEWVAVPSAVTHRWKALSGTKRGLRDAALSVPSQNETHGFCRVTTKTMVVIMQIFCMFQELRDCQPLGCDIQEGASLPQICKLLRTRGCGAFVGSQGTG